MLANQLLALLGLAVVASAQTNSSTASLPECVLQCSMSAVQEGGCGSLTNLTCICTSQTFMESAQKCLANCTTEEQAAAASSQNSTCSALASSTSSNSTNHTSSSTTTSKSGATEKVVLGAAGSIAVGVAIGGAILGSVLSL